MFLCGTSVGQRLASPRPPPSLPLSLTQKKISGKADMFDISQEKGGAEGPPPTASLIPKEDIKLGKKIGEGAHGSVHEGTWSNEHGSVSQWSSEVVVVAS